MGDQSRHPAGTPEGGRFAEGVKAGPDTSVTLGDDTAPASMADLTSRMNAVSEWTGRVRLEAERVTLGESAERLRNNYGVVSFTTFTGNDGCVYVSEVVTGDGDGSTSFHERGDGDVFEAVEYELIDCEGMGAALLDNESNSGQWSLVTLTDDAIRDGQEARARITTLLNNPPTMTGE